MKAILVDAKNQVVRQVYVEGKTIQEWYRLIDCELVTSASVVRKNTLFVDDEGLLKPQMFFFANEFHEGVPQYLAGNGLWVGTDESGETVDCDLTVEEVKSKTRFLLRNEVIKEVRMWEAVSNT